MSFTHTLTQQVAAPGRTLTRSLDLTGDHQQSLSVAVPDEAEDQEVAISIDQSQIKSLYLVSDQDVTIETNNGTTPDDTISLLAGQPLVWQADDYYACPITVDVTSLFITNASGSSATVELELLVDATP